MSNLRVTEDGIRLPARATPPTPPPDADDAILWLKTDGVLRKINGLGTDEPVSGPPTGAAGGSLAGTYPNPTVAAGAIDGAEIAAAIKDPAAGTAGLRTLGSGAQQAAPGNDSRLSDSRAPTGAAGGSLGGTYPNPSIAAGAVGGTEIAAAIKDPAAGTAGLRTLGTGAAQAAAGNDSRLSDSRAPSGAAGGSLTGTYPNPTVAAGAIGGTEVAAAIKDPAAGTAGLRTLGTGAAQAAAGDDARLSDARAPVFASTTVTSVTADQNNYNIFGTTLSTAYLSPNANPRTITGFTGGTEGRIIVVHNASGSNGLVLSHESASSTAANRIIFPSGTDFTLPPGQRMLLAYDGNSRWAPVTSLWLATNTVAGLLSNTDKAKLDNVVLASWVIAAPDFDTPNSGGDWPVTTAATLGGDPSFAGKSVLRFDDTAEWAAGVPTRMTPTGTVSLRFTFHGRAITAPGTAKGVQFSMRLRETASGVAVESYAETDFAPFTIPTNALYADYTETITLSTLSMVAGRTFQAVITRQPADADDNLVGDWALEYLKIEALA